MLFGFDIVVIPVRDANFVLAAFDNLKLEGLVAFLFLLDGDFCMSEYISLDPWGIKLFFNKLNYIFHLVPDSSLLLSKPIKLGLFLSNLFPLLIKINPPGIRVLVKNIQHTDQDIPSQILIRLHIVHGELPLIISKLNIIIRG